VIDEIRISIVNFQHQKTNLFIPLKGSHKSITGLESNHKKNGL